MPEKWTPNGTASRGRETKARDPGDGKPAEPTDISGISPGYSAWYKSEKTFTRGESKIVLDPCLARRSTSRLKRLRRNQQELGIW